MADDTRIGRKNEVKCLKCSNWTTHTTRGTFNRRIHDREDGFWGNTHHDLLECDGCHSGTYRSIYTNSEMQEEEYEAVVEFHPPRPSSTSDRAPKKFERFEQKHRLWSAYIQTLSVANAELPTMAAAGIRLLVEGVCKEVMPDPKPLPGEKPKKGPNLFQRIEALLAQGFIGKKQAETLHHIRESGNDSLHEAADPDMDEIGSGIAVMEHLLAQAFDQPHHIKVIADARKKATESEEGQQADPAVAPNQQVSQPTQGQVAGETGAKS